ncbi:SDR family oxidoreductase [Lignipirellula cremea]|uniref:UDP-glucose 4-epimerase n=1 Tax=Lignipirellula cremea TaxID=2528010 RepID=A0A518DTQ4_9BACT|nr:SDR family oxidoreductase [Lignipirellula cremea]QDU95217.1 UDP-glucose 4-epimerase [Lignipirellula cremea]
MAVVLVTGGAGFIGSHLVDALVERGHEVKVFDNFSSGSRSNLAQVADRIEIIEGDLSDAQAVKAAVVGVNFIFHEGALASVPRSVEAPLDTHAACVTGTLNVLNEARQAGVQRVIYAGSSSAYGDFPAATNRESDFPGPLTPYGAAKLAGEFYCRVFHETYGLETITTRYFNVFGPRQDPDSPYSAVIPLFITKMLAGTRPTIFGDGQQSRDFTYIANVVHANMLAMEAKRAVGQTINVANGRTTSLLDLIAAINEMLGLQIQPQHDPPRVGDIRDSMADITIARRELGYEPQVDFHEGLQRSIEYYKSIIS